ncbi:acyltransferase [Lutibacter sp. TH_r2]|uniref:acyltransferase family protein n=1 Tax=Lutibacter sp. TH_r2 TaxID=3082083 RepID=UPI002952A2DB|nr:acyltransferase [Lutibacter sp. TH_r2]MDV7188450.1 acyltransferase [Lutibacter sp. TH_r2]
MGILKKRFIRLYPLLFYTTIVFLLYMIVLIIFRSDYYNNTDFITILYYKAIDTLLFLNSTPIFSNTYLGLNEPSWSISSEMISYLLFGAISLFFIGKEKNITLILIIIGSALFVIWKKEFFFGGDFGFIRGFISFNCGYFIWYFSKLNFKVNNLFEYLIPILLIIIFYNLNRYSNNNGYLFALVTIPLFYSFSIFILLKTNGFISKFLDSKPILFLGKISYSIYLNHMIILILVPNSLFSLLQIPKNVFNEIIVLIITVVFILFYSKFTYLIIETKGGKFLKKILLKYK